MNNSCLIISSNNNLINWIKNLCGEYNIAVESIRGAFEALELIRLNPYILVFIDNKNKSVISNKELIRFIRKSDSDLGIYLLSEEDIEDYQRDELKKQGVSEIFFKGDLDSDKIKKRIENILFTRKLESNLKILKDNLYNTYGFNHIIGKCNLMQKLFDSISRLKDTDVTVFINGESGTGKELIAKEIHNKSSRKRENFIAVNCAAIPETLLESELFGHEKGSFTGASSQRKGKFESANKGTIFLDEIGELSVYTQAKILRTLEEREIERIGGNEKIKIDVRIITATNKDLDGEVKKGNFRNDLLYRINVFPLYLPPLRERGEDIEYLTIHFFKKLSKKNNRNLISINRKVLELLKSYDWPGNIRELENVLERSIILCSGSELNPEDIQISNDFVFEEPEQEDSLPEAIKEERIYPFEEYEKMILETVLRKCEGNIKKASSLLKIGRSTFHRKIKKYGLEK